MGFGHRDERSFDGVMRLAFCVDETYERQVGVEVRQDGGSLELRMVGAPGDEIGDAEVRAVTDQVARVLSVDHDGEPFAELCNSDRGLARLAALAPGFRPALFYSPYEAAVWSILSARRARSQAIPLRTRMATELGVTFDLAGVATPALPTPSTLLATDQVAGLPADRIPRLHAVATAAQEGRLAASRLASLAPEEASAELQQLPGIGPFYSSLILLRACGLVDLLPVDEGRSKALVHSLYRLPAELTDAEYAQFAERWRPYRTWAVVTMRALSDRLPPDTG